MTVKMAYLKPNIDGNSFLVERNWCKKKVNYCESVKLKKKQKCDVEILSYILIPLMIFHVGPRGFEFFSLT